MATITTARTNRASLALLILGVTMASSAFVATDAHASCGDTPERATEGRALIRAYGGVVFGLPTAVISTFLVPAVAVGADSSLDYGGGVAWSAVGAFGVGGTALGIMTIDCPYNEALFVPALSAFGGSVLTTTIWALASSEEDPNPPVVVGVQPVGDYGQDGAMLTFSGQF